MGKLLGPPSSNFSLRHNLIKRVELNFCKRFQGKIPTYEASLVEEYIILSASYAVLQYTQFCLRATFSHNCLALNINIGGNYRMSIDRSTLTHLVDIFLEANENYNI